MTGTTSACSRRSSPRIARSSQFSQIPPLILDATTAVEDRTFWENQGYDLQSTVFASLANLTGAADRGGASTITQQLVRAVLLPKALLAPGADLYERKAKELIQSAKLTEAFPGEEGKQRIITAYLNQIFYGHNAYGIAAAAQGVLRQEDVGADPERGGPAGRPAPVTLQPRPIPVRVLQDGQAQGQDTHRRPDLQVRREPQAHRPRLRGHGTDRAARLHPAGTARWLRQVDQADQGPGARGAQPAHRPRRRPAQPLPGTPLRGRRQAAAGPDVPGRRSRSRRAATT